MTKEVPFKANYDRVKAIGKIANFILYLSCFISLIVLIITKMKFSSKDLTQDFLNSLIACLSVFYFFADIIQNYFFQSAEFNRKDDFIDNSFKTKLSEKNSTGYFSNDNIGDGIIKFGVNCFENSFFTKNISSKMLVSESIKSTVVFGLFILIASLGEKELFITLLQIALPLSIIQQTIKLLILNLRVKKVFSNFKQIFSSVHKAKRNSLIIDNVLNYEKTLSWASIQLDSKIFDKLNPQLSIEWERIKSEHVL